ncbi:MAG: cation acetate symporter [Firmicutes bacterium]|nr:cation acetate symporter [Bacillota bacterium]
MDPRGNLFVLGLVLSIVVILISVLISVWARRFTRNLGDYYVAGRSIGAVNNGLAMVSLALSLTTFVGLTALMIEGVYIGVAVYAAFTSAFIGLLLLAAPFLRRHKSFTTMAFIDERFNSKSLRVLSVIVMLVVSMLYLGGNLKGIGIVFYYLLGIPELWGIILGGIVVTLYVTIGGMYGVTYNQTFQTIVLIFCLMFPVAIVMRALGSSGWFFPPLGYGDMVPLMEQVAPHYFWPMLVHPSVYISVFLGAWFGIIGLPHFVMRYFTVRDSKEARWSTVITVFLVGLVSTTVYATGFAAVYFMNTKALELGITIPREAYDYVVFILIENLTTQGWLAVAIAGSIAAALSTVAGLLMIMGAGLIHDLYCVFKPDIDDERKLKLSYGAMLVIGVLVILFSLNPPDFILEAIMWAFGIAACSLGVPIVLGIWWKRTTKQGVAVGMTFGFILTTACFIMIDYIGMDPVTIPIPFIAKYLYGPFGWIKTVSFILPLSFILTIVVSWLTPPPDESLQRQVDEMHGWSDYDNRRYNGNGLPITIIILSLLTMFFVTTLYGVFPGSY